ncbi:MAG TPA: MraY family glycosyltransferase [Verrucomicrobiota bacterium]|nr:MraY family glycosyltransferase [Verrucomicrobiota bacterium]
MRKVSFPFNLYLLAVVSACLTTLAALPLWRRWCLRTGLVDDPGHRKIHAHPVPLAGGLAVMTGLVLPAAGGVLLLAVMQQTGFRAATAALVPIGYGLSRRSTELAVIFAGALGMLFLGWLDDKHELRPRAKFAGQVLVAALVAAGGVRITLFVPSILFSYVVTILWMLTVINAFNFMDNMNGLCAGLGAIGAWYFAAIAAVDGQYLVALIAFLTLGALLGFLPYNFPNARAFLGDAGSHLVGYLLAVLAILPHFYSSRMPRPWAVLAPLLILALPLADMAWVVVWRWRAGRPFYVGDTNHLSHRLVRWGLSPTRAVLLIWLAATAVGALAVFSRL